MHELEYELHRLACQLERGSILPKTAAERLFRLATMSHDYISDRETSDQGRVYTVTEAWLYEHGFDPEVMR
jgi:hypothetical protein